MGNEVYGASPVDALRALAGKRNRETFERKFRQFDVWAGPLVWGPWTEVWAQFGVKGPEADRHVSYVRISFDTQSNAPSPFHVEIKGGDRFIRSVGPGEETVTVTGNISTAISIRCKSATQGQNVLVTVG
ncbi:colicin Z C-terminal domain-related protein [Martelella radicis]|uniref:Uncharacterized protein n=1 Tax=Martelella radicis TaxID=1397476 RepID=A0A7W6KFT5_9HYPH|nr:colicin Z C-terminal domain-related protein [Martelella radicis]MBB4120313.1 hypothetical protein [Martelella radicis]